ncbi:MULTISPECIES: family 20 glycosylhydrolase [unclassified Actinotalea]|uniref:family 20 glycosylhydrolase n=1 Tax=unclassified Actinotalea TaxID=2638618 RepID=UPI0015F40C81|nr:MULTISPECIES: family 20 glycosylhydrolase [unclassified Actinotalea]
MTRALPLPALVDERPGAGFLVTPRTLIAAPAAAAAAAERLAEALGVERDALTDTQDAAGGIALRLTAPVADLPAVPESVDREAYAITVGEDGVVVTASDVAGLRHGATVLAQLAEPVGGGLLLPALRVEDRPRFAWRGLSLDVARSFFPVASIHRVLDVMASLRLNVLHLHLTDDQGWRLEIASRPRLTELSGGTAVDGGDAGFYTAADYARIVDRAADLGIVVVPEVDVPGHVNAALHAEPALNPDGEPVDVYTGTEVGFSRLRLENAETVPFLTDVFTDVAAMTPGPFLHLGGDEPLSLDGDEYVALVDRAVEAVTRTGKRAVAWQEAARTSLPAGTVVQFWHEQQDADVVAAAAAAGARVLLSPASRAYLDMKYDEDSPLGLTWAGCLTLDDAYGWEPLETLPGLDAAHVAGVEAAVWTETIHTDDDLFSMLLPRLAAFAEVAWTPPHRRDLAAFRERLDVVRARWTAQGLAADPR